MTLHISGATKEQLKTIRTTMSWTLKHFISEVGLNRIIINIQLCEFSNPKNHGYCTWADRHIKPREFLMEVQKALNGNALIHALIHECIHINQFYKGHLSQDLRTNEFRWKGKVVPQITDSYDEYLNFPWEREAYRLQKKLYKKFVHELYNHKKRADIKKLHK